MRIDLPDGQWAEITPVDKLTARVRREVKAVLGIDIGADGKPHVEMTSALPEEMKTALIAAVVTAWSYEQPVTPDAVWDLPLAAYDQLADAVAEHEAAVNFSREAPKADGANSSA